MNRPLDIVKAALQAYVDKDRAAIEALIADDYHFTSPIDNAIDRSTYFGHCWPNSQSISAFNFIRGFESGDLAWIVYEATANGKRFRNTELHRVRNGRIVETEVYFGWTLPHAAPAGGFIENDGP